MQHTPLFNDGGEGLLIGVPLTTAECHASGIGIGTLEDGGSFFADHANHCWYRQNLNGDLRQWGLTQNSDFDAIYVLQNPGLGLTLQNASPIIHAAFTALGKIGITELHTEQVNLKIGLDTTRSPTGPLQIPTGASFTCDAPPTKNATNADYTQVRGSLIIAHGIVGPPSVPNFIDAMTNSNVEIHDCAVIIPEWYINPSKDIASTFGGYPRDDAAPVKYIELEQIRANMILASDVAIKAGNSSNIHDVTILGFDNCLEAIGAQRLVAKNIMMDCSVGFYGLSNGGLTSIETMNNLPLLTRQGIPNELSYTITKVEGDNTNNGECKLTLQTTGHGALTDVSNSATSDAMTPKGRGDPIYYPAWVSGLGNVGMSCLSAGTGRFGNDAAWAVDSLDQTNIGAGYVTVDLLGSVYASTSVKVSTTGDWSANTGVIRVTGPISNITPGMTVTQSGGPGWPSGNVTVTAVVQRATGPDQGLPNSNDGYNGEIIVSPAPTSDSSSATLSFASGADSLGGSPPPCGSTGGACFYYNAAERYISGNSDAGNASARMPASRGGHMGAAYLLDKISGTHATDTIGYGHYYNIAAIDAADCVMYQVAGDDNGELDAGNSVGLYVAGISRGCLFIGNGPGKPGTALVSDTYGTSDADKQTVVNADLGGLRALGQYQVSNGSNLLPVTHPELFAARGVAHICSTLDTMTMTKCDTTSLNTFNEFVSETVTGSNLSINVRARFGTAPVDWNAVCPAMTCAQLYVFPVTINGGSVGRVGDPTASTNFSAMDDNTTTGNQTQFEVLHGAATFQNLRSAGGGIGFVSTNAAGATIASSNIPKTALMFEDSHARVVTTVSPDSTIANSPEQGALNLPLSYYQWFGSPQAMSADPSGTPISFTSAYLGPVDVQDTTNWPQTGILLVDSEYVAFHIQSQTQLYFDKRGACGSQAAMHNLSVMGIYMSVTFGCPSADDSNAAVHPQFTMDGAGNVSFAQSMLAHGQVYMSLSGTNVQLCPKDGKGIIISGVMREVDACALAPTGAGHTVAATRYYVYATFHQLAVTSIVPESSGTYTRLYLSGPTGAAPADFFNGSPVSCYGITGMSGANVTGYTNTDASYDPAMGNAPYIDLLGIPASTPPHGTGACQYIGLELSTTGHVTGPNGVEIQGVTGGSSNLGLTLVGMVFADSSNTVNDSATERDVASWFNRQPKKMLVSCGAGTTAGSTYKTPSILCEGEFVLFGPPASPGVYPVPQVGWAVNASVKNSVASGTEGTSLCFGTTSRSASSACTAETEEAFSTQAVVSDYQLASVSGATTAITEGRNFADLAGFCTALSTCTYNASHSSIEVNIAQ